MELTKVYKSILSLASIEVDDDDKIYTKINGQPHYIKHGGKDIYIPSKKAANTAALHNGLIFNPLNENVLVKKDVVFHKVADKIIADFNSIIGTWVYTLAKAMEQNGEAATTMSPQMLEVIKDVGEVPKDFSARMMMFAAGTGESNTHNRYLAYKITGGDSQKDKTFNKKCTVWSPYKKTMDSLYMGEWSQKDDDKKRVAGAVMRKSDGKPFERMLKQILPGLSNDAYNGLSLSQISPTVDAFLKSVKSILIDMTAFYNKVKTVEDFEWPEYDLAWVKFMENVDKHTHMIRNMPNDCANVPVSDDKPNHVGTYNDQALKVAQEKANAKLMRDSVPANSIQPSMQPPPWEEEVKVVPVKHVQSSSVSGPTVQDLISGQYKPAPGVMTQAIMQAQQTNTSNGAPTVMSLLGNNSMQNQYRAAPVQTLLSGSLVQNRYSPSTIAQVPSMTNMSYPGRGF